MHISPLVQPAVHVDRYGVVRRLDHGHLARDGDGHARGRDQADYLRDALGDWHRSARVSSTEFKRFRLQRERDGVRRLHTSTRLPSIRIHAHAGGAGASILSGLSAMSKARDLPTSSHVGLECFVAPSRVTG